MENASVPYVWKINDTIFRGRHNIMEFWYNGLCWCYDFITNSVTFLLKIIPKQLAIIKHIPGRLFSLIFGRQKLNPVYTPDYGAEVMLDFWDDILQNELKNEADILGN